MYGVVQEAMLMVVARCFVRSVVSDCALYKVLVFVSKLLLVGDNDT